MNATELLIKIKNEYQSVLGDSLIGFYVHGSVAFGCFSWERGDLDFLAVVTEEPTDAQKRVLIEILLANDKYAPQKGFEMSVVTADAVRPFVHPTPFVLHYSNAWRDSYRADIDSTLRTLHGTDPDLAAHITVLHAVGIPLHGKPIAAVFDAVPHDAYLDSIRYDIEHAREDIDENPVYVTLNLCRVLAYIRDGKVLSKAGGGAWGVANLTADNMRAEFIPLVSGALAYYKDGVPFVYDAAVGQAFAEYMLSEIYR